MSVSRPIGMLAELTHRCPLSCPYCSNPVELERRSDELDTETWKRVFTEALALGVLQVHLSGGEPAARRDLAEIISHAALLGLYTNLITSAAGVTPALISRVVDMGLDHVQVSMQGADAETCDRVTGRRGSFGEKLNVSRAFVEAGVPLTVNTVFHRANIHQVEDMVALAEALGARRIEVAHAQYYGWAMVNRNALMPKWNDVQLATDLIASLRERYEGRIVIDAIVPDYYARRPKPCMGGWAKQTLNVTPSGKVLPCHAAETIPGLEFWFVRDRSLEDIWMNSPAFTAFRGTEWMQEPCSSCEVKNVCLGGCRCQALALVGDARAADPVCELSPFHDEIATLACASAEGGDSWLPRSYASMEKAVV